MAISVLQGGGGQICVTSFMNAPKFNVFESICAPNSPKFENIFFLHFFRNSYDLGTCWALCAIC